MSDADPIDAVLAHHRHDGTRLMQILRETQEALGWLAPETITRIAAGVGWPRARVEATAAFYSFFQLRPRGAYCLLWSDNIIDRMAGSRALMQRLCEALWLEPGKLSEDGLGFVHTTSDIGMGDQGPALLVNYRTMTQMNAQRVDALAELIRNRVPLSEWPAEWFHVDDNLRRAGPLLGEAFTPGAALAAALEPGRYELRFWASADVGKTAQVHANLAGKDLGPFTVDEDWKQIVRAIEVDERKPGAVLRLWTSTPRVRVWFDDVSLEKLP